MNENTHFFTGLLLLFVIGLLTGYAVAGVYYSGYSPQTSDHWQAYTYYYPNGMKEIRCVNTADSTWANGNSIPPKTWDYMKLINWEGCTGL